MDQPTATVTAAFIAAFLSLINFINTIIHNKRQLNLQRDLERQKADFLRELEEQKSRAAIELTAKSEIVKIRYKQAEEVQGSLDRAAKEFVRLAHDSNILHDDRFREQATDNLSRLGVFLAYYRDYRSSLDPKYVKACEEAKSCFTNMLLLLGVPLEERRMKHDSIMTDAKKLEEARNRCQVLFQMYTDSPALTTGAQATVKPS